MKQGDGACFLDRLVERIGEAFVGVKALEGRVELEPLDPVMLDQAARLADAHLALVRVD